MPYLLRRPGRLQYLLGAYLTIQALFLLPPSYGGAICDFQAKLFMGLKQGLSVPKIEVGDFILIQGKTLKKAFNFKHRFSFNAKTIAKVLQREKEGITVEVITGDKLFIPRNQLIPLRFQIQSPVQTESYYARQVSGKLGQLKKVAQTDIPIYAIAEHQIDIQQAEFISSTISRGIEKISQTLSASPVGQGQLKKIMRKIQNLIVIVKHTDNRDYVSALIHEFNIKNLDYSHFDFLYDRAVIVLDSKRLMTKGKIDTSTVLHELGHGIDLFGQEGIENFRSVIQWSPGLSMPDHFSEAFADLTRYFISGETQTIIDGIVVRDIANPLYDQFFSFLLESPAYAFDSYYGIHSGSNYISKVFYDLAKVHGNDKVWMVINHFRENNYFDISKVTKGILWTPAIDQVEKEISFRSFSAIRLYLDQFITLYYPELKSDYLDLAKKFMRILHDSDPRLKEANTFQLAGGQ